MAGRRRWVPLAVSLVLLVGLGLFGFTLVGGSRDTAEAALRDTARSKQATLATLTDQYLQLAAKEAFDFGETRSFELTPESEQDRAALDELLTRRGSLFGHGALLSDLTGAPLTTVARSPGVPPADDPGYAPLRASLLRGEPGISSVMDVEGVPVVAIGVPVMGSGTPVAVLVAYFRADTGPLQAYSSELGRGRDVATMVVDRAGTVVAAHDAALVGHPAPASPAIDPDTADEGFAEFDRDGEALVVAFATESSGGWTLLEEQDEVAFYAPVRAQSDAASLLLLGALVLGGAVAVVFNHRATLARRRAERRSQALVEDASDVIMIVDGEGRLTYVSPTMHRVLGFSPAERLGTPAVDLLHPKDVTRVADAVAAASNPDDRQRLQAKVRRADGDHVPCELVISNQLHNRSVHGMVVSIRDVTELVALHDQLSYRALHDPLTELPNRTRFEQRLTEALTACRDTQRIAVLFVDLDGFKPVNDQYGHDQGDEVLIDVSARLRRAVREADTVARLGGDEFVVVIHGFEDPSVPSRVAQRILDLLGDPFRVGTDSVHIGASIGVAIGDADTEPGTLLREADAAMYLAKERGRFRFEFAELSRG